MCLARFEARIQTEMAFAVPVRSEKCLSTLSLVAPLFHGGGEHQAEYTYASNETTTSARHEPILGLRFGVILFLLRQLHLS
jgi:hypothetical protein